MKMLDLNVQYESIKKEIDAAIKKVVYSASFIGGEEVESFEKEAADFCGIKYAVSVHSGTDALFLSLKALNVGPGDEVITTPFTFIASAEVIVAVGAKPVFVDIDPSTFNIDASKIEKAITKRTKAIIPVHLFGQAADMREIIKIAKKYKLFVVEDAAQAFGAEYMGKKAGSFGDLGCFSFYPSKNLGAYGCGGMVITDNEKLAEKLRLLRNHGSSLQNKYLHLVLGVNSRLDAIQAAVLRVKLKHLPKWNKERAEKALYYDKKLKGIGDIVTPRIGRNRTHIFHQYTVKTKKRDELHEYLKSQNIPTQIHYPLSLHMQPAFKYLGQKKGNFPVAEKVAKEVISLPIYPELKKSDIGEIVNAIKNFFKISVK